MKRALIFCICLGLAPTFATAAGFEIRSGEHDGFSRLVIYLDRPRDWEVAATETGYALILPETTEGFDTSGVFEFIPKRRLVNVKSAPGRLALDVPCDCPVQAFAYRPDILVLDIHSGTPDPDSVPNAVLVMPHAADAPETVAESDPDGDRVVVEETAPTVVTAAALSDWRDRGGSSTRATRLLGFSPPEVLPDQRLDRSELVAGIAQAASHGLITLSDPNMRTERAEFPVVPGLRVASSQVSVRDSLVRGLPPGGLSASSAQCLPAELFAVPEWGDPDVPASIFLSDLRAEGPPAGTGRAGSDGAIEMIRSYLFLGFGSEAAELVRTYRMSKRDERVYQALAAIVDFPGRADRNPLADQLQCDSPAVLWAFVATSNVPVAGAEVNADVILRSFQQLPWWLRVQIGETAAANFDARGDAVSAGSIRASVDRARAALARGADMGSDTEDAAASEPGGEAHHALSDRAHRMRAAQAMLYSFETTGGLPTDADRAEITALVLETRGSEESVALLKNYVDFASAPGDILASEQVLTVLSRSRFSNAYPMRAAWNQLLAAAVAQPSHDVFLGLLARNERVYARTPPDRSTADAAIARLVATGLPDSAADFAKILDATPRRDVTEPGNAGLLSRSNTIAAPDGLGVAAAEARGTGLAEAGRVTEDQDDAVALRQLLSASAAREQRAAPTAIQTDTIVEPTLTPLDTLLASEAAIEVLGRVLGTTTGADG